MSEANEYVARLKEKVADLLSCDNEHDRIWLCAMIAMLKEKLLSLGVEVSNDA